MFLRCGRDMLIANNTFYDMESFLFSLGYDSGNYSSSIDGMRIVNNVAYMHDSLIYGVVSSVPPTVQVDHNLVHSETGYIGRWPGMGQTRSLATFRSWSGFEPNGIDADPGFADADAFDFRLRAGSPAVDAGTVVPGVTDGATGAAPDLGAFERP